MPPVCHDSLNGPSTAPAYGASVVDLFTLALTHGLIALALIRLISRRDLDDEGGRDA